MPDLHPIDEAIAKAAVAAWTADMTRHPSIAIAIKKHGLGWEGLRRIVYADLEREVRGLPGPVFFPEIRAFWRQQMAIEERARRKLSGMGQFDALGSLFTSVANVYVAKTQAKTATQIAKIQAQTEQSALDVQSRAARLSAAEAQGWSSGGGPLGKATVPVIGTVAVLGIGGVIYFATR